MIYTIHGRNVDVDLSATRKFGEGPLTFLSDAWVNPANYAQMHGFAQWNTYSGVAAAIKYSPNAPLVTVSEDDLCIVGGFVDGGTTQASPVAYCALERNAKPLAGADYQTRYSLVPHHHLFKPIYFLPSRANQISCLRLDATPLNGRPRVAMTTAVNGCSIFVTCRDPSLPLDASNDVWLYHANGVHAGGRPQALVYTRRLLRKLARRQDLHLALELTTDHYYGSDIVDEQQTKANKGYTVNATNESTSTFLVFGLMGDDGVWGFHYQWHADIDYNRTGVRRVLLGKHFQGAKHRVLPLHVPQPTDWATLGGVP